MVDDEIIAYFEDDDEEFSAILETDDEEISVVLEDDFSGTNDYNKLINQPMLNDIVISGNKKSKDYKLQDEMEEITNLELDKIFKM